MGRIAHPSVVNGPPQRWVGDDARLAGYAAPEELLALIARQVEGTQYGPAHAPEPLVTHAGVYGYAGRLAERNDPCYRGGGVVRERVEQVCGTLPQFCPAYTSGPWLGRALCGGRFFGDPPGL